MDKIKEFFQDNKRIVLIGIIGAVAIMGAIYVIKPFNNNDQAPGIDSSELTAVYVIEDIPEYTVITEEMVDVKEVGDEERSLSFSNIEDVVGAETYEYLEAGTVIQQGQIDDGMDDMMDDYRPMGGDLSNNVPEGLRAIMMPAGPAQGMVEYLEEGDTIDLLVSHTNNSGVETITPFQNIEVLLIDESFDDYYPEPQSTEGAEEGTEDSPAMESSSGGTKVILAMTPEQTEVLSNMKVTGLLETAEITLRNKEDDEIKTLENFSVENFDEWRNR